MHKRPYVQILGYVDKHNNTYTLKSRYFEGNEEPLKEELEFLSLESLLAGMKRCVKHAKRLTYDYDVDIIVY